MIRTDHPPSTASPTRLARRALSTSLAAIVAIAAPVAFVAATAGGPNLASASEPSAATTTSIREQRFELRVQRDEIRALSNSSATRAAVDTAPATTEAPATTVAPPPEPPAPAQQPVASGTGYNDPNNPAAWDRLAQCESGGNWAANTGNGYYGGIQFSLSSWQAVGGTGRPDQASRETQIAMGQRLWNQGGWSHWPGCSSALGYR
jgi:resuscitation-promoting factor RpfB